MANTSPTPYACIVFNKDKSVDPIKVEFCKSIYYLHNWLQTIKYDYHYINIYNRKTKKYLARQYFNTFIIDKPPF